MSKLDTSICVACIVAERLAHGRSHAQSARGGAIEITDDPIGEAAERHGIARSCTGPLDLGMAVGVGAGTGKVSGDSRGAGECRREVGEGDEEDEGIRGRGRRQHLE
jgi:hypothetical protein